MINVPDARLSPDLYHSSGPWQPRIFAHRGASGYLPENTVAAVRLALEMGADGVEIDIHPVEGRVLVLHDAPRKVASDWATDRRPSLLATLRSMDVGNGYQIPFLEEVTQALADKRGVLLNIEVKDPTLFPVLRRLLSDCCRNLVREQRVLISSFHLRQLAAFHLSNPDIPVGCLAARRPPRALALARSMCARSLHLPLDLCSPKLVAEAHDVGIQVFVFTVNTPRDVASAAAALADGLFTDYPDYVRRLCRRFALPVQAQPSG